jgi:hypothetical protein
VWVLHGSLVVAAALILTVGTQTGTAHALEVSFLTAGCLCLCVCVCDCVCVCGLMCVHGALCVRASVKSQCPLLLRRPQLLRSKDCSYKSVVLRSFSKAWELRA